jgi:hypothetical protein
VYVESKKQVAPGDNRCNWKHLEIRNMYVDFFHYHYTNTPDVSEAVQLKTNAECFGIVLISCNDEGGGNPPRKYLWSHMLNRCQKNIWYFSKINQKIPEELTGKARNQGTTEDSRTGHCTHTAGSAGVKVQNIQHGK